MKVFYSPLHRLRDAKSELHRGELVPPFESPQRAELVLKACREHGLGPVIEIDVPQGTRVSEQVHDPGYVEFLRTCSDEWRAAGYSGEATASVYPTRRLWNGQIPKDIDGKIGFYALASETSISPGTWEAAYSAMHVALAAAEDLRSGSHVSFGLCRPPGHHAARDQFGGYCFLNNAAVAAQSFIDDGSSRVAVLDVDFHHGNGTQDIFYERDDVLFVSIHGHPEHEFPYFLGFESETGSGAGEGFNLNLPLLPGTDFSGYSQALATALKRIATFNPQQLVISLGLDSYFDDPISSFKLTTEDFWVMGREIKGLGLPTLVLLEGGYATEALGLNAIAFLRGVEGDDLPRF